MSLPTETRDRHELEPLRRAFTAPAEPCPSPESCPEPDRIWAAVHGELEAEEIRDLIDHTATCTDCAEDWRLAHEVGQSTEQDASQATTTDGGRVLSMAHRFRRYTAPLAGLAAAAVILLMIGLPQDTPPPAEFRAGEAAAIRSLLPAADQPLSRDHCLLRWSEVEGARYTVVASDARLTVLAEAHDLTQPSFQVPAESLVSLAAGDELYWQVEATLPDGTTRSSKTFIQRIE